MKMKLRWVLSSIERCRIFRRESKEKIYTWSEVYLQDIQGMKFKKSHLSKKCK